jgi:hypothetical protein
MNLRRVTMSRRTRAKKKVWRAKREKKSREPRRDGLRSMQSRLGIAVPSPGPSRSAPRLQTRNHIGVRGRKKADSLGHSPRHPLSVHLHSLLQHLLRLLKISSQPLLHTASYIIVESEQSHTKPRNACENGTIWHSRAPTSPDISLSLWKSCPSPMG